MRQIVIGAAVLALATAGSAALPVASANTILDEVLDLFACRDPGPQGTITTAPTGAQVPDSGWEGSEYHVYGGYTYTNVDRYNHCVANRQIGAVWISYGGSSTYDWCVNCLYTDSLLA